MMDQMTSYICCKGIGRLGYARVLVEIEANKDFLDRIKINYVDNQQKTKRTKWVKVEYAWKPVMCSDCNVFGHSLSKCALSPRTEEENEKAKDNVNNMVENDGFAEVRNRRNKNNMAGGYAANKQGGYQGPKMIIEVLEANSCLDQKFKLLKCKKRSSNVNKLKKSANKYALLSEENDDWDKGSGEPMTDRRLIVDEFLKKKIQPSISDTKDWSFDMINYFKYAWKAMEGRNEDSSEEEDVYEITKPAKELKKFIGDEKLQFIAILETHLKTKNISKVYDKLFGSWSWISNVAMSPPSCRIVVGWNAQVVNVMVIHVSKQAVLCLVETIPDQIKTYVSIIYASNNDMERRELWDNLLMIKSIVDEKPWVILGYFNVTLKPEGHSNGGSGINSDMQDFSDVVNNLKAKTLKISLQDTQSKVDKDTSNVDRRKIVVKMLDEYTVVATGTNIGEFVKHFQDFLGNVSPTISLDQLGDIINLKLSCEDDEAMIVEVTDKEIKEVIFDIDPSKASSLDGYTSFFSKKAYKVIRKEVCLIIKELFSNGKLLGEVNATLIALVPKIDTPNKISDFRPIACCNVLYRCISKIITNRIKIGLNKVVNINQSAFIPGRHIQDNILLTQELLRGYDRKQGAKRCAIKIDIQKAYDTASWKFFSDVLIKLDFIMRWGKRFKARRPYVPLHVYLIYGSDEYDHDELLMMCNGDVDSLKEGKKQELLDIMPFKYGKLPMKYLGVPLLAKILSRIQLIKSVLSTMHSDSARGKAKVEWSLMCRPKDQGGLGLKPLQKWNEVLLVSQLWKLIERKESLWVKWVNTVKFKNTSIREVESINSDSCVGNAYLITLILH
ncbi:RNA-directed DNA polymerase, eukaryota, reverse transcriptase zinc-binding domain protein [Tanacetum coccineum]